MKHTIVVNMEVENLDPKNEAKLLFKVTTSDGFHMLLPTEQIIPSGCTVTVQFPVVHSTQILEDKTVIYTI